MKGEYDASDDIYNGKYDIEVYEHARDLGMRFGGDLDTRIRERIDEMDAISKSIRELAYPSSSDQEVQAAYYRKKGELHVRKYDLRGQVYDLIRSATP